jgi:hypothetical protein
MSTVTRLDRELPAPYRPAASDPLKLSQSGVNAVEAISERTAKELEGNARELENQAKETGDYLRRLATLVRQAGQEAAQQVSAFCLKNAEVLTTIQGLEQKIKGQQPIEPRTAHDDGLPSPSFLHDGGAGL